jgi:hypothetical protein
MCSQAMARRCELSQKWSSSGRQQFHCGLQPQHGERHPDRLHRLGQAVYRAVGQADQRRSHGNVGRGKLLQRMGVQLGRSHDGLQPQKGLGARRYHDGAHSRVHAHLLNVLVNGVGGGQGASRRSRGQEVHALASQSVATGCIVVQTAAAPQRFIARTSERWQ